MKIIGARGDWTADVEGSRLAVIHQHWWTPPHKYFDPMIGAKLDGAKYKKYVEALRLNDLVVMQRGGAQPSNAALSVTLDRLGYIGVFRFSDLVVGQDGAISLKLTEHYASPKR